MGVDEDLGVTRTRAGEPSAPWGPSAAIAPDRVGGYQLLRKLGEGGMGVVYAAYHEVLDRTVALKLVHDHGDGGTAGRAQMLREAQALARLSHPNVVQVHEVGEHLGQIFLVMEYIEGPTLDAWQTAPGRGLAEILGAYHQAAIGLQAAHAVGLVHRDFKPSNAIVGVDGRVRVVDFGLARARAPTLPRARAAVGVDETVAGTILGTPAYMSPEQFAGLPVDARSDIFSLCVALWEAIHGVRPFAGETVDEVREGVLRGERRPPTAGARIPARLQSLMERGLEGDRARRLADLGPLIAALASDPDADPSAASRERAIYFAVVVGVVLLLIVPVSVAGTLVDGADPRWMTALGGVGGLAIFAALSFAFRRTLLGNAYHRRMILFLAALLAVVTSQRLFGIAHDAPHEVLTTDSAHLVIGMSLCGAIFFARWMAVLAGIMAALLVTARVLPDFAPVGFVLGGPLTVFAFGYFWRRDARRIG
ncbi:MAG: serine/threonine-protein kinase [Nannocystaceae bacterium]